MSRLATSQRPGRVIRPGLFILLAALGCASPRQWPSISSGYQLDAAQGIALVHVEQLDEEGRPDAGITTLQTLRWFHEESGAALAVRPVNAGPIADFYLALPPGNYRMLVVTGAGWTERWYVLRLAVAAKRVSYAGAIQLQDGGARGTSLHLKDEYDAAVARFAADHPALAREVAKQLFERLDCGGYIGGTSCEPVPFSDPETEAD